MVHVYSEHLKQRVIDIYFGRPRTKYPYAYVRKSLQKEEIKLGRKTIRDIILRYNKTHSLQPRHRFGRQPKTMNPTVLQEVESYMRLNDEATNAEIKNHLANIGIYISITSIRRVKKFLGWTYQTPGYCQLIRHINKTKRVDWANRNLLENFDNVIWSDETSVWLEKHKHRNYHKKGESKKPKPRAKYPVKVHVWAGISRKGATGACIFEGTMNAELYIQILENTLVPFIKRKYGPNHRFMQDNDPKHTSRKAKNYFAENGINWWETPPGNSLLVCYTPKFCLSIHRHLK